MMNGPNNDLHHHGSTCAMTHQPTQRPPDRPTKQPVSLTVGFLPSVRRPQPPDIATVADLSRIIRQETIPSTDARTNEEIRRLERAVSDKTQLETVSSRSGRLKQHDCRTNTWVPAGSFPDSAQHFQTETEDPELLAAPKSLEVARRPQETSLMNEQRKVKIREELPPAIPVAAIKSERAL